MVLPLLGDSTIIKFLLISYFFSQNGDKGTKIFTIYKIYELLFTKKAQLFASWAFFPRFIHSHHLLWNNYLLNVTIGVFDDVCALR